MTLQCTKCKHLIQGLAYYCTKCGYHELILINGPDVGLDGE